MVAQSLGQSDTDPACTKGYLELVAQLHQPREPIRDEACHGTVSLAFLLGQLWVRSPVYFNDALMNSPIDTSGPLKHGIILVGLVCIMT